MPIFSRLIKIGSDGTFYIAATLLLMFMFVGIPTTISYMSYDLNRPLNSEPPPPLIIPEAIKAQIDQRVDQTTSINFQNYARLTAFITDPYKDNELFRVYAIYRWITSHITYDYVALRRDTLSVNVEEDHVFQGRNTVCEGYANLFSAMALEAGLVSEVVYGHAIDTVGSEKPIPRNSIRYENHAWNIVRINGNWYPLDPTWDAGFIDDDLTQFTPNTEEWHYFLIDPTDFRREHEPTLPNRDLITGTPPSGLHAGWHYLLQGRTPHEFLTAKSRYYSIAVAFVTDFIKYTRSFNQ